MTQDETSPDYPETSHRLRVRYCETDRMGVAHHGSYLDWFEEGRCEWLRARGKTYRAWEEEGVFLQVAEVKARYLKSTTFEDELEVVTRVGQRTHVSIVFEYEVFRQPDGERVCTGSAKMACVGTDGRLRRLPKEI